MRTGDRARHGESTQERDGRVNLRRVPQILRQVSVGWAHRVEHVAGRPKLLQQAQNCCNAERAATQYNIVATQDAMSTWKPSAVAG